jgi:hypothetical protein
MSNVSSIYPHLQLLRNSQAGRLCQTKIKELFLIWLTNMLAIKVTKHVNQIPYTLIFLNHFAIWHVYFGHQEQNKGSKRKNGGNNTHDCKAPKLDGSIPEGTTRNKGKVAEPDSNASSADLQQKLKEQIDTLWKLKDGLKKHVSTTELRNMLEANKQDSSGPERHLLDRW